MNVNQMEIFLKVAQTKQFSHAAKAMHLTQPAVSAQIKVLEEQFGTPLFLRTSRGVELTEAGKIFERYVTDMLYTYGKLENELDNLLNHKREKIKIGATQTIGHYVLPEQLAEFKKQYREIDILLEIADTQQIIEMLQRKQIDIGIAGVSKDEYSEHHQLHKEFLFFNAIELITPVSRQWDMKLKSGIQVQDLRELPFIMPKENSCLWNNLNDELCKHDMSIDQLNTLYAVENIEVIKKSVREGLGFSVCSSIAFTSDLQQNKIRKMTIPNFRMQVPVYMLYYDDYISSSHRLFLSFFKNACKSKKMMVN